MKKVILSLVMLVAISFVSCKTEKKETTKATKEVKTEVAVTSATFGVRGNCGMCKSTIEKAVNAIDGVAKANWDKDKKKTKNEKNRKAHIGIGPLVHFLQKPSQTQHAHALQRVYEPNLKHEFEK